MMPSQQLSDSTMRSNASSSYGQNSLVNNASKRGTKIKAYVDFTDFNKNFEEYKRKTGAKDDLSIEPNKDSKDESKDSDDNASNSTEDWVVLSQDNTVEHTK